MKQKLVFLALILCTMILLSSFMISAAVIKVVKKVSPIITMTPINNTYIYMNNSLMPISISCSATDTTAYVKNISLWADFSGGFKIISTNISKSNKTAYVNYTTIVVPGTYHWGCSATDNNNNYNTSTYNYTLTVIDNFTPPIITSVIIRQSPLNGSYVYMGVSTKPITVYCNATSSPNKLSTVSLYSDFAGEYGVTVENTSLNTSNSLLNYTTVVTPGIYHWGCSASDVNGVYNVTPNYTLKVMDQFTPPTVSTIYPSPDFMGVAGGNQTFSCNATSNPLDGGPGNIYNIEFWNDFNGTMHREFINKTGMGTTITAYLDYNMILPINGIYHWYCYAFDSYTFLDARTSTNILYIN